MTPIMYVSKSLPFLWIVLSALVHVTCGQFESLIPEGLLDFVPESCMEQIEKEILPCAIEFVCFSLIPSDAELAAIPDQSEIESCADIEAGLCPITTRCPDCKEKADNFFRCVVLNNEEGTVSQEVADLVGTCPLDCSTIQNVATEPPMMDPATDVDEEDEIPPPTVTPVIETASPSIAPSATASIEASPVSRSSCLTLNKTYLIVAMMSGFAMM